MDRPLVVVAEPIAESGLDALRADSDVVVLDAPSVGELHAALREAAGLIVRSATDVDADLIRAAPHLRVIGRAGIGVDNIDLDAATEAGIVVVNAPNANIISAAEHTMALLLAQARMIPEADASLRSGVWDKSRFQGVELEGKTLGILGLGNIGALVAARAAAFGMRLLAFDPYVSEAKATQLGVELADLDTVLADADFITVHLPLTTTTEGLVGKEALAKVKPGVRVINAARGGIVDEEALAEAVRSGVVAGAAFDVFSVEPMTDSPLFELPQVVVTPHLGASTEEAQGKAGTAVAKAVADALRGGLVLSAVNVDFGARVSDEVRPYLPVAEALGTILTAMARGLPEVISVTAHGWLADHPVEPLSLGVLKGALGSVSNETVSYVNVHHFADQHGVSVRHGSQRESADYTAYLELVGTVDDRRRVVAGTLMERKGPSLVSLDGYEIELPITPHMLLLRNDDTPGVIGRVGTLLGDAKVNIADMAVGRNPHGGAMMGLSLDGPLPEGMLARLISLDGVASARYVEPIPIS